MVVVVVTVRFVDWCGEVPNRKKSKQYYENDGTTTNVSNKTYTVVAFVFNINLFNLNFKLGFLCNFLYNKLKNQNTVFL